MQTKTSETSNDDPQNAEFAARVEANQRTLTSALRQRYDFIVCGSGSSGSVVARRLAENPAVSVLLLEAGGTDAVPEVQDAARWSENLGSDRDWAFRTRPNPHLNGRALVWSMGKVLGGSSSINVMVWARGHRTDWDYFARESGDDRWSYRSVLEIYRRIEDWRGAPDPKRRGAGGLVVVEQSAPHPLATALCEGASSLGVPCFSDQNGVMMEMAGGAARCNIRIRDGKRLSVFRSYLYPYMDRPNLTVLTHALVTRIKMKGARVTGIEAIYDGASRSFDVEHELILSLGAVHTPKILMQSGIGDAQDLRKFGIDVVQHLPGVGQNLQEHLLVDGCVWEYAERPHDYGAVRGTFFCRSDAALDTPDVQAFVIDGVSHSPDTGASDATGSYWSIRPGIVRPHAKGRIHLTGPDPMDPVDIETNLLSDPADLKAALRAIELSRDLGNSAAFSSLTKREMSPGRLRRSEMENFVRDRIIPFWHFTCTAKMGRDEMSVVDGSLKVHGIEGLRIADGSIMPRVTTGNTMAPCVIIGERAAAMIREAHAI
ncbi:GMC family oxidoreductase N-terminal domain-containing protein [Bradyrhizobium sp. Ai1a-2]|uniref:GMC family oxidoreductase n=1 Tax=Bradyrhizobium sp. Ai1a-2 TaxID=196490 RepID=UPI0004011005|nr:GMC family oxidoreductase N-terminal domain-containing protein [Bradyrhizobium sp. Ai1a-2]